MNHRCAWAHTSLIYPWNRSKPCTCLKGDLAWESTSNRSHCTALTLTCSFSHPQSYIMHATHAQLLEGERGREHVLLCVCVFDRNMQHNEKSFTFLKWGPVLSHLSPCPNLAVPNTHTIYQSQPPICPVAPPVSCCPAQAQSAVIQERQIMTVSSAQ